MWQHDAVHTRLSMCLLSVMCVAMTARAEPVFLGTATRGSLPAEKAQAYKAAIEKAVSGQGVRAFDTSNASEEGAQKSLQKAQQALDDAATAFSDGEFGDAFKGAATAIEEFDKGPAFSDDPQAWSLFKDICALRALAALKLKKKKDAEDALRWLLTIQPKYSPNKSRAPPELLERVEEIKDELRSLPPASLELKSKPSGAQVIIDGKRRGKTPLVVEDLTPGTHYVAMESSDGRFNEKVSLGEEGGSIAPKLGGGRKGAQAKDVVKLLRKPITKKKLVSEMSDVDDDAIVAVLLPAGKKVEMIGARVNDGELKAIIGVRAADNDNDRERAAYVLVEGLLERERDAWLDQAEGDDPSTLRDKLFESAGASAFDETAPDDDEEGEAVSPAVVAVSVIGGAAAVVAIASGVGFILYRESRKDQGFTWGVDASGLQ
jgi:hypothetical protein